MLVLVALSGRSYELDCGANTRVEQVVQALASLTGVAATDQILICAGVKLDVGRTLSHYGLPGEGESAEGAKRVFLYSKPTLRYGAPPPPPEPVQQPRVELPPAPSVHAAVHPLDESSSPLIRALPHYERQFNHHLQKGQAVWRATQARFELCRKLVAEMHVQALAIDSARENVDVHFAYICKAHAEFEQLNATRQSLQADLLGTFEQDMVRLRDTELHPAVQVGGQRTLLDCVSEPKLRKWRDDCANSYEHFSRKVGDLSAMFTQLQNNVEELFMTGPDVDVGALEAKLEASHSHIEEQATIMQSLAKDLNTVKKLVEDTVGQISHDTSSSTSAMRPLDACSALDPMNESHLNSHLPTIEAADTQLERMLAYCVECKGAMSRCVCLQLQSISQLQSRIRDMRNKLAAFKEVGSRQEGLFRELQVVRRVPQSYRACLAEVARRHAYAQLYAAEAGKMAEQMGKYRDKEVTRREAFLKPHQHYLPGEVLRRMGLYEQPPQCEVSVPANDPGLLNISDSELRQLGLDTFLRNKRALRSVPGTTRDVDSEEDCHTDTTDGPADESSECRSLSLENAKLRADLAAHVAVLCMVSPDKQAPIISRGESQGDRRDTELGASAAESFVSDALAAKDAVCDRLREELASSQKRLAACELRVNELEERTYALGQSSHAQTQELERDSKRSHVEAELKQDHKKDYELEVQHATGAADVTGQCTHEVRSTNPEDAAVTSCGTLLEAVGVFVGKTLRGEPIDMAAEEKRLRSIEVRDSTVVENVLAMAAALNAGRDIAPDSHMPSVGASLSFAAFGLQQLAAFVPDEHGNYMALSSRNAPRHFLSVESAELLRNVGGEQIDHCIVGQIIRIENHLAQGVAGGAGNPYNLPPGTEFVVVDACAPADALIGQ
mmetsp:Transcript_8377/g.29388  ORF Transcript_8377/g.29388 Transcript_8377/m.29388 type:complete len:898 (-) Transcript_8377:273-2966(-)|eukprot:CAMPEP_0183791436 /NCGR_PEP_ID=MMETSP0803_2-20130417/1852_1 /TAXON_ID=195967 /ORGANISM="Crustomastix stigmata, Strain CCMP3273" /LENGTH=897 /DNA_ID=CAMNT_0026035751 /DNA_START=346 /DNA_END=3039 /DNA_ORIENTATION=+